MIEYTTLLELILFLALMFGIGFCLSIEKIRIKGAKKDE